jgi:4-amino-4-deoxy-L-arabinose transferase-like glycosyltransferase
MHALGSLHGGHDTIGCTSVEKILARENPALSHEFPAAAVESPGSECSLPAFNPWVFVLAAIGTLLHLIFNRGYGYFRDELYYAACGQHLAWGYVDHAPLAPAVAHYTRALLGDSLSALRFVPALSSAAKILIAGWMAREMRGGRTAQFLAALTTLIAPIYLTFDNFLSMNAFEPVFWMLSAAIVLRLLNGGDRRLWLLFGLVAGIGILNKHSMLFFGSGLALGLLLTVPSEFKRPWIWLAAAVSMFLFLPNFVWEMHTGWPTIALLHSVIGTKYTRVSPWAFLGEQTLLTLPLTTPLWMAGLWFLLRDREGRRYGALGIAYLIVLAEMLLLHGKIYYLAPAYIMLLAAGSVWLEKQRWFRETPWTGPGLTTMLVVAAIIAAPLAMPILPVKLLIPYARFWDVEAVQVENVPQDDLPQLFGDMFGWKDQVASVAEVYGALPMEERAHATIAAYNYGEAGAIDYFGRAYGLPPAISGHNQYGFWGPGNNSSKTVIAIGYREGFLRQFFDDVQLQATISPQYALPEERNVAIFVCRRPKTNWGTMWPRWKYLN